MRDYVDRRVTPPKRVTSPTWGPPPLCKQALTLYYLVFLALSVMMTDRLPLRAEFIWYYFRSVQNTDCVLRTTDPGLGIKYGLGIKHGLRIKSALGIKYGLRTALVKRVLIDSTVSDKNSWDTQTKRCFFPSRAPLVPLKVVYRGSVTKPCTPTLRGQGDTKVSQQF